MSEPRHEKCKFVLLALVVPSSELQDLPSFTTGAGFVAANVAHFDRHLTEKQQKKLQPALAIVLSFHSLHRRGTLSFRSLNTQTQGATVRVPSALQLHDGTSTSGLSSRTQSQTCR